MKQETKTAAQISRERIDAMPQHPDYYEIPDLPIPTSYGVLILPVEEESIFKSEGGILMSTIKTNQSKVGILYGVGPECKTNLKIGIKVRYTHLATDRFYHNGKEFVQTDEMGVLFVIPDPSTLSVGKHKDGAQIRKEHKLGELQRIEDLDSKKYLNEKDKRTDKTKGKIVKVK